MDRQLLNRETLLRKLALLLASVALAIAVILWGIHRVQLSDPYVKTVLTLQGDPVRGHAIFQMNCTGCHGFEANGKVGPSLRHVAGRKSRVALIYQVTSGRTPPMPQFQPDPQEMADLLQYLESL